MGLGILILFFANFVGGAITPMFVKLGVGEIPPLTFTALRFTIALLVTLPIYLKHTGLKITKQNIKWIFTNSIFFTLNMGLFSIGIQYTNVVISQILYAFVPVLVAILSHFLLKEGINKYNAIGALMAFFGLIFLISRSFSEQDIFGKPLGNLIIMVAVISWSFYMITARKIIHNSSQISLSFANFLIATLLLSVFIPIELSTRPFAILDISSLGIASLMTVGIFSSAIYINLLQIGIKRTGAFIASLFYYIGPLSAAITAVPFLGEKITLNLVIGGILILFGVFFATTYSRLKQKAKFDYGLK